MEAIVALHGEGYRFELREVDIESDELLLRAHLERIPVVEVDGERRLRAGPRPGRRFGRGSILWGPMIERRRGA